MPKTYSHLLANRRMPTEYELTSTQLLYYPRLGVAVRTPAAEFHARHACRFRVVDWEAFHDPAETTYASYVTSRREREIFVQHLVQSIDGGDYDARLERRWLAVLERLLAPLRYPCHGLQMLAAYVAHSAPAGRIAIAAGFQCADELRRISWFAYRTKQLSVAHPGFADAAKSDWQNNPALQPLREVIERLLVAYEWGEAFVGLNVVLKPLFDEFFGRRLSAIALAQGDDILGRLLLSLCEDQRWHAAYSCALTRQILASGDNRERVEAIIKSWLPRVLDAIGSVSTLTDALPSPPDLSGELARVHDWIRMQCSLPAAARSSRADPLGGTG